MADIGATLRETRMRARIDISEVEVGTKIRAKYLRALENEEWDLLPGPVYVKSFLKTYGDYLGLDSRLLVDEFKRRYERPMEHEARTLASTARERERHRNPSRVSSFLMSPRSVIGIALVVIVAALYIIGSHTGGGNGGVGNITTPTTATDGHDTHHQGKSHSSTNGTTPTTPTTGTTSNTTTAPAKATIALVPTAPVWICVENAAGKPLFTAQTFDPGEKVPAVTGHEFRMTLGNSDVTMTVNGKAYPLSGSSNAISLKITPNGVTSLTSGPTCSG
jgi:cytoskeleton protein RodZ